MAETNNPDYTTEELEVLRRARESGITAEQLAGALERAKNPASEPDDDSDALLTVGQQKQREKRIVGEIAQQFQKQFQPLHDAVSRISTALDPKTKLETRMAETLEKAVRAEPKVKKFVGNEKKADLWYKVRKALAAHPDQEAITRDENAWMEVWEAECAAQVKAYRGELEKEFSPPAEGIGEEEVKTMAQTKEAVGAAAPGKTTKAAPAESLTEQEREDLAVVEWTPRRGGKAPTPDRFQQAMTRLTSKAVPGTY